MTSDQVTERIHEIVQSAVQRSGGDWKKSFYKEVCQIIAVVDSGLIDNDSVVSQKID